MNKKIEIYDTTLRDGMQGQGASLSVHEKLRIVQQLDQLGIDLIEAGFPAANPKDAQLFELLSQQELINAQIVSFGMTRRRGLSADSDPGLQTLANCFAPICCLVGKTWSLHLQQVLRVDPEENLAMIFESVNFLVSKVKKVIYDAEHFFDGFYQDREYALKCLATAIEAGAQTVTLCDTNGAMLPNQIWQPVTEVVKSVSGSATVGIHTHNDCECAVANSLVAVQAGATHVQGTINGYGERCGNANLISIIPNLQLKLGYSCISDDQLSELAKVSYFVDELCNVAPNPDQPYVGKNAFAHKGGLHVAGVRADPATFEHIDPGLVGNQRDLVVSELSGKGTVEARARNYGFELDSDTAKRVVEHLKKLEHEGYHFEAADGSFELLLRKELGEYQPLFRLESWRVITDKKANGRVETEATIKIWVNGERYIKTAEGNGPVSALNGALRAAIGELYPHLINIHLVNFKVRIFDEAKGTEAGTRVLLDTSDGEREWGSIGVSTNIIEASWEALVDSLEYGMQKTLEEEESAKSAES